MRTLEESFYFIADLHTPTTIDDPVTLRNLRRDIILDYLACGFDPGKATIYQQSDVPEHCIPERSCSSAACSPGANVRIESTGRKPSGGSMVCERPGVP